MRIEDNGASLVIERFGEGLIAGDLRGGDDPWAVLRIWRKAERLADALGMEVVVTADTARLAKFYARTGMVPSTVVFKRIPNGKDSTVQGPGQGSR